MKLLKYTGFATSILLVIAIACKPLEKKLDRYLLEAQYKWGFEGVALVAVNNNIILSRGYGMANLDMGEPNTPKTKFFIGSITKQFTAAAILILYQDGLVKLDDPIARYLPDYPKPNANVITIHHLLMHSSGIPNYTEDPEILLKRTDYITPEQLMKAFEDKPLEFEPGTDFRYSNSGYIVLGAIIERVSGQSYEAFLHNRIFKPLGMTATGYARRESAVPDRADGYTQLANGELIRAVPINFSVLHTAGALYSTVEDMLKWDLALDNYTILDENSVKLMLTAHAPNYGYGWFLEKRFGRFHSYHGGFLDGFNTTFERWPDDHLCIIVFANEDEAPVKKIARSLAAIIYGEPYTTPVKKEAVKLDTALLDEYTGVYKAGRNEFIYVELIENELYIRLYDNLMYHLYAEAEDKFFFANDNTETITFKRNDNGNIESLIYKYDYGKTKAEKLPEKEAVEHLINRKAIKLDPAIYDKYTGQYLLDSNIDTESPEFILRVKHEGESFLVAPANSEFIELYPRSETEFFHRVADFKIEFVVNENGDVKGVVLTMGDASIKGVKIK